MGHDGYKALASDDAASVVWWVDIAGIRQRFGSCTPQWSPSDTSTSRPILPYLSDMIEFGAQSVEPLNGKTKGHTFTFSLLDVDDSVTRMLGVYDLDAPNTYLTSACTLTATTLHVSSTSAFSTPCDLFVGPETMRATSKTTLTFAVTRGMYSSTTARHVLEDDAGQVQSVFVWDAPRYIQSRRVRLYEGRTGMDEADSGGVSGVIQSIDESEGVWRFRAAGTLARINAMVNTAPATAWASVPGSMLNPLPIYGGHGTFATATIGVRHPWVQVGDAVMAYSSVTSGVWAMSPQLASANPRLMYLVMPDSVGMRQRMVPSDIEEDLEVTQLFSHAMFGAFRDPVSVALVLLLSKRGDGANHATYDILPPGYGIGLDAGLVDVDAFEELRDTTHLGGMRLQFEIPANQDAKKWLEEHVLRPCLLFLTETWDGQIGISRLVTRNEAAVIGSALDIDEDMLLEVPDLETASAPIGEIKWKINRSIIEDEYLGEINVVFQESVDRYGATARRYELEVATCYDWRHGLGGRVWRSSEAGALPEMLGRYIATAWDRFAVNPLPALTVELPYAQIVNVTPGNVVRVTCAGVPDMSTGERGLDAEWFQVIEAKPDPGKSTVVCRLWQIGVHNINAGRVAPSLKVRDIANDFGGGGRARIQVYRSVFAPLAADKDIDQITAGDVMRFLNQDCTTSDSVAYTVHSTGSSAVYDWVELNTTDVDNPPNPVDGSYLDTTSRPSATATQQERWAFMCNDADKHGDGLKGNQRT